MRKKMRFGLCALGAVLCTALLIPPAATTLARHDVGQASFYTYRADGIAFTSNCLSEKPTTVWLPTWTVGSDPSAVEITFLCEGGIDSGALNYTCEDTSVTVSLSQNSVECPDGQVQKAVLTVAPSKETTAKEVKVHVQWQAGSGTRMADFILPIGAAAQEEVQPEVIELQVQTDKLCYLGQNGEYRLITAGVITKVAPISGTFPAFTWYSADGGASWNVMAYESTQILVETDASQLRLKGEPFEQGFYVNYRDGEAAQVLPENICSFHYQLNKPMALVSDTHALALTLHSSGVKVADFKLMKDGKELEISQSGLKMMTKDSVLTLSAQDRSVISGTYTLVAQVYLNGEPVDTLETTFFVNYRYTG